VEECDDTLEKEQERGRQQAAGGEEEARLAVAERLLLVGGRKEREPRRAGQRADLRLVRVEPALRERR
jgi:hypothetical protein